MAGTNTLLRPRHAPCCVSDRILVELQRRMPKRTSTSKSATPLSRWACRWHVGWLRAFPPHVLGESLPRRE